MRAPQAMLSTTAGQLPVGDGWVLQPKWDGYRLLVEVAAGGRARAWTRHGTSLSGRVGDLEQLVAAAVPTGTILDGELVVLVAGAAGPVQSFAAIGASVFGRGRGASLRFVAFDVLCLAGEDLRARPWEQRDARLRELLADANERLTVTPTMAAAAACHQQLVALGSEGSVLKQRRSPYRRRHRPVRQRLRRVRAIRWRFALLYGLLLGLLLFVAHSFGPGLAVAIAWLIPILVNISDAAAVVAHLPDPFDSS